MKKVFSSYEFFLFIIFVIVSCCIGLITPVFFGVGNIFKILKSSVEMGMFALCFMLVLILGGIDMSFSAIGVASMYTTITLINHLQGNPSLFVLFLIAGCIGMVFGAINGVLIGYLELPTLIVTLGTMSIIHGGLVVFVGKKWVSNIPDSLVRFSKFNIIEWTSKTGEIQGLHSAVLILIVTIVLVYLLLKYTWYGRSIFAIGGNPIAAKRHGINVVKTKVITFIIVGFISGITGLIHCGLVRMANPFDMVGGELNIIAAVVLGGASLAGGSASVVGTVLGVFLINIINNSLILLGIPSYWQKLFIGGIVILSTLLTANRDSIGLFFNQKKDRKEGIV